MILNNYYNLKYSVNSVSSLSADAYKNPDFPVKNQNGDIITIGCNAYGVRNHIYNYLDYLFNSIVFSDDTKTPTTDDYNFSNIIQTSTIGYIQEIINEKDKIVIKILCGGQVSEDCTIRQVGIVKNIYIDRSETIEPTLMIKDVLKNPISLKANENLFFEIVVSFYR